MKKLTALLIALSFTTLLAAPAFATNPVIQTLDEHAVWTKWVNSEGSRVKTKIEKMETRREQSGSMKRSNSVKQDSQRFGFIHETKTYDYAKDHGDHA